MMSPFQIDLRSEELDGDLRGGVEPAGSGVEIYFLAAARASRLALAQPSLTTCLARPRARESAGTSSVIQEAAATYALRPMLIGATRVESLPTNTPSAMRVRCFSTPS